MVDKIGDHPANARVDIDYSSGKPEINFSYPDTGDSPEKQSLKQHRIGIHTYILVTLYFLLIYLVPIMSTDYVQYPSKCNVTIEKYTSMFNTSYTAVMGANFTCNTKNYTVDFNPTNNKFSNVKDGFYPPIHINIKTITLSSLSFFLAIPFFILNEIITRLLLKSKRYKEWFPKHQAKGKNKKYIKFSPEDVENNMVEIPLFANVYLDYKTEGDFSKQLVKVKIREHNFNVYRKGIIGKKKVSVYKWYARFYFKDTPKDGFIEVIFR